MANIFDLNGQTFSFKCPQCKQFISSATNECKFCKTLLTPEIVRDAIENQKKENRQHRFKNHLKHFFIGLFVLTAALILNYFIFWDVIEYLGYKYYFIFYLIISYGLAELAYGVYGFVQDVRDKYKNA